MSPTDNVFNNSIPNTSENVKENAVSPLTLTEPDGREIVGMPTYKDATEDAVRRMNGLTVKTGTQKHIDKIVGALKSVSKVAWDESVPVGEGRYNPETKTITLNPNSSVTQNYAYLFKHEFTHSLEGKAKFNHFVTWLFDKSKSFDAYVNMIAERNGIEFTEDMSPEQKQDAVINHYVEEYSSEYGNLSPETQKEYAKIEMVADYVGGFLFTGESYEVNAKNLAIGDFSQDTEASLNAIEEIANEDKSVIRMIIDFIRDLKNKINLALGKNGKTLAEDLKRAEQYLETVYKSAEVKSDVNTGVKYSFGVTQKDINQYVKNAKDKIKQNYYKKYAAVSERLLSDVADDIDLYGYSHALRDNDIRHILNSHGEQTNEKYPVTIEDIEDIPYIVENYDKVFYNKHNGNNSIVYVKVSKNGITYYVEQATDKYGNEDLLVNKQMIKTGIEDIPGVYKNAINKKEETSKFLADLKKIHEEYAQGDVGVSSVNSIRQNTTNSQEKFSKGVPVPQSIDNYTEEQYNDFGWVSVNEVLDNAEREALLSRFADHKKNGDKYPVTRFGEAVIHSYDHPDVIAYIKGDIGNPQITKVVRIKDDISYVKELLLHLEEGKHNYPFQTIASYYGQWILDIDYRKDYAPFRELKARTERGSGEESDTDSRTSNERKAGLQPNSRYDRADDLTSAFSMPENEKHSKGIPVPTLRYNTEEFAKSLIRKARSTIEVEDVTEQLKEIVKAYNKFDTDTADKLISKLTLEIAEYQKPVREYYAQEYLDNLKGETVRVFKEDMGDIDFAGDTLKGLKESTGIKFVIRV